MSQTTAEIGKLRTRDQLTSDDHCYEIVQGKNRIKLPNINFSALFLDPQPSGEKNALFAAAQISGDSA